MKVSSGGWCDALGSHLRAPCLGHYSTKHGMMWKNGPRDGEPVALLFHSIEGPGLLLENWGGGVQPLLLPIVPVPTGVTIVPFAAR